MFDTALVAANRRREAKRKLATLPAALAVHALALALAMAGQLWAVNEVPEPFTPVIFVPPTPPPAAGTHGGKGDGPRKPIRVAVRSRVVQPETVPSEPAKAGPPLDRPTDPRAVDGGDDRPGDRNGVGGSDTFDEVVDPSVVEEPPPDPIILSPDVIAPVALARSVPEYPEIARKAHREGVVVVQAVIDRDGSVASAEILRDIGLGCGEAAVRALRTWRYTPATLNGRPVSVYLTVTFTFHLTGAE